MSAAVFALALILARVASLAPEPRVFAVLAEFDRMAQKPLWPGFDPKGVPLEILDEGKSWLVRHPQPPTAFEAVPGHPETRVFEGWHPSLRANTAVDLSGTTTATAAFSASATDARRLAGLLLHEAFHVFQKRRHPSWGANEADLFVYPVEDAEALALRRLESAALARALSADSRESLAAWSARASQLRQRRFARLPGSAAAYERSTELKEGLARYIEAASAGPRVPVLPENEFAPADIRERGYASGCAMALLLERLDPGWKASLEAKDGWLDELLAHAVSGAAPAAFSDGEEAAARQRAERDVAAWKESRTTLRAEFLASPGWTVLVEAEPPLFPQGFDPLNVERLSASEVLHTRFVKLGNDAGVFEALERRCLTEAFGRHPLFEGVKRATIAGLTEEPVVRDSGGGVRISAPGLTLGFESARVSRDGRTITVRVGSPEKTPPP